MPAGRGTEARCGGGLGNVDETLLLDLAALPHLPDHRLVAAREPGGLEGELQVQRERSR